MKQLLQHISNPLRIRFFSRCTLVSSNLAFPKAFLSIVFIFSSVFLFSQPLSGTKTINASGSGTNNYTSFTAAVNDLVAKGVNGPVLFQVASGTYSGQITVPAITGANATNTITFDGGFGNAATRTLTYTATSTTDAYVVRLNSTAFINFKNLTIKNTGTAAALGVSIFGSTNNCSIVRCNVYVDSTSTSTNFKAIQMTNSTLSTDGSLCGGTSSTPYNITIDSNTLVGGNISFYGTSSYSNTTLPHILFMRANNFRLAYLCAVGIANVKGYQINGNLIDMRTTNNNNYGFSHCNGSTTGNQTYEMVGNTFINCGLYGIYSLTRNSNGQRSKIWNNYFRGDWRNTSAKAIYMGYDRNFDVWANTIVMQNNLTTAGAGIYIYPANYLNDVTNNNIVLSGASSSGYTLYSESGCIDNANYNNYYKLNNASGEFLSVVNGSQLTWANYKGFNGFDANSYSEDPFLVSATNPSPNSICLKGVFQASIPKDINGNSRLNPPTVGCAESSGGLNLDAEIVAFTKPSFPISSGNNDIEVTIKNKGLTTLTSLTVSVSLGSTTRVINWTGSLASCQSTNILFDGSNQLNILTGKNAITAFVSNPNSGADQNNLNDTIKADFCTPFSAGTYTIDPSGSGITNYKSIAEVTEILNCGGVDGAVVFDVAAATFTEKLELSFVRGASSTNTITFNGAGVGSTILVHPNTTNSSLVSILGTSYVTVKNMTMQLTNNTNVAAVRIALQSDYVNIQNNSIEFSAFSSLTTFGITFGDNSTTNAGSESVGSVIENNKFSNVFYGVQIRSASAIANSSSIIIRNNEFNNVYAYGVYMNFASNIDIDKNTFVFGNYASAYGIYSNSGISNTMRNNNFKNVGIYGMYIINDNSGSTIYNNMIANFLTTSTGTYGGIYTSSTNGLKIYHNTVYFNPQTFATTGNRAALYLNASNNADVQNNIFIYDGASTRGVAVYRSTASNGVTFDNNMYYSSADVYTENFTSFYKTLADWQAFSTLWNLTSIEEMPQVVSTNPTNIDLHLSPTYDAPSGNPALGIDIDIDGDIRCIGSMTMGADQSSFPQLVPIADFVVADFVYSSSGTRIVNTSKGNPIKYTYQWYVDGLLEAITRDLDYTFLNTGNYNVSLVVSGCAGKDSIGKTVSVILPSVVPQADFVADKQIVDMFDPVNLRDLSKFGATTWQWSASPKNNTFFSNDIDQNPFIYFGEPGYYDVCLSVENHIGKGKDTCKNSYIYVRDDYSMCSSSSSATTTGRFGKLYDDGGFTANYATNRNCTYFINPCASSINLKFNQFTLGAGDVLYIYDGSSSSAPLIGAFDNTSGIPGGTAGITATSGQMFINWVSDASGVAAGFAAEWTSVADNTPAPIANFTYGSTLYEGEEIKFTSTSTGNNLSYSWDFDPPYETGGNEGGDKDFDTYSFNTAGTYDVKLRVSNCAGAHSITQKVTVLTPSSIPVVDFVADRTLAPVMGAIELTSTTTQGPLSYRWEISPKSGVTIKPSATSKNITTTFMLPGVYTVKLVAANSIGEDSTTKTSFITIYDYCDPGVASSDGKIGISNVTFAGINNTTASGTAKYTNYLNTNQLAKVIKGGTYPISIARTNSVDEMNRKIWVDWNIDGDFDDAGELVATETASRNLIFTDNITVPTTALAGITRMRVGVSYGTDPNHPCGLNHVGEFEDYSVQVIGDIIKPIITLNGPAKMSFEQWYQFVDPGFTAIDDINGNINSLVTVSSTVDSTTVGTYKVTYQVTDVAGNSTIVEREVEVTPDVTLPQISLVGSGLVTHTVNTLYADAGATASDYFNRNLTSAINSISTVNDTKVGVYTVTHEIVDLAGNKASIIRTVNVVDDVAPVITKVGDTAFVEVKTPFIEPGVSATDNYDVTINVNTGSLNTNITGTYKLSYTATDSAGNTATEDRIVVVRDTKAPIISINGLDTMIVDVFGTYTELGAVVTDNYCTNLVATPSIVVNTNKLGNYLVQYDVTDCEGNIAATKTRLVRVVDRVAPILQLKGFVNTNKIMRWMVYADSGVSYSDNYYTVAELTPNLKVTSNVNTLAEGIYEYCYDLTDPSGNIAQRVCRTVEVVANTTSITEDYLENAVNIYPNPTSGIVNIAVTFEQQREVKISVLNILGQVVTTLQPQTVAENNFSIDLSQFAAGLYMVHIETDGATMVKKVNLLR